MHDRRPSGLTVRDSPRLYVAPEQIAGARMHCDGDVARRLAAVLRLRAGDEVRVFDGLGRERRAQVELSTPRRVTLALLDDLPALPEPPVPVTLVCAFPRGNRGDWIVEKATELGVARLVPLAAGRAVLRPGDGRLERWQRIAIEAAEQCGRAVVPAIGGQPPENARVLIAHPGASPSIRSALVAATAPPAVALFVGPEGGWDRAELTALLDAGGTAVSLGVRTLRVETAAIVAVAEAIAATGEGNSQR